MKKVLLTLSILLFALSAFSFSLPASEKPIDFSNELKSRLAEERFLELYKSIDYGKATKPAYQIFRTAFIGYLNLAQQNKLPNRRILSCIDFSLPSTRKRLWIIDLEKKKVLFHDLVAHGKNTGGNMATKFSNVRHSNMSSLGFYVTANKYYGKHGLSLRLSGQEVGFNDKAMERAVVMHGAKYVNPEICKNLGRLGRSFGCPAVSMAIYKEVINTIAEGSCLFIYYPDRGYLSKSLLLKEITAIDYFLSADFQV